MVVSNDERLARRLFLFINKAWGYGDPTPDHYFLALNSRMSEIQGAVALGQLEKLNASAETRRLRAEQLTDRIRGIPGIEPPPVPADSHHVYWRYCLVVDPDVIRGGAVGLAAGLRARGISSAPRYIQKPAFMCEVFQQRRTFGNSHFPFSIARPEALRYDRERYPGTFEGLDRILVLPWNENYSSQHVDYIAGSIQEVIQEL